MLQLPLYQPDFLQPRDQVGLRRRTRGMERACQKSLGPKRREQTQGDMTVGHNMLPEDIWTAI